MNQAREAVTLPESADPVLRRWAQYLTPVLGAMGWRINRCLPSDGSERMKNPLPLAVYTTATRPDPTLWIGSVILVSDAVPNQKFQGSDGSAWIPLG